MPDTKLASNPQRIDVASEIIFEDEASVQKHYAPLIRSAQNEIATSVRAFVQQKQQQVSSNSKLIAVGVGLGAVVIAGLTISTIITGVVGISLLVASGLGVTVLKYRYPVWVANLRSNQVIDLARAKNQEALRLIDEQNRYINKLQERARSDPVATRQRIAQEMADEIDEGMEEASKFEGLIATQDANIDEAIKQFPGQNFQAELDVQKEMKDGLVAMKDNLEVGRKRLDEHEQRTRLIITRLKLAAGARSMAEFMRDDSAADRIRKMVLEVATESAEQEFQEARAKLRSSVAAAKRRSQQQ